MGEKQVSQRCYLTARITFFLSWNHFNKIDSLKTRNNEIFVDDEVGGVSTEHASENTKNREDNPEVNSKIELE